MARENWPATNTQIAKASVGCDECAPGYEILSGPGREVLTSHVFTVGSSMVVLRGVGFRAFPKARACLQMEVRSCDEQVFEDVFINGTPCCINSVNNTLTVTASGRYRVVIEGADAGDVWVTQGATDTGQFAGLPTQGSKADMDKCAAYAHYPTLTDAVGG